MKCSMFFLCDAQCLVFFNCAELPFPYKQEKIGRRNEKLMDYCGTSMRKQWLQVQEDLQIFVCFPSM